MRENESVCGPVLSEQHKHDSLEGLSKDEMIERCNLEIEECREEGKDESKIH